MKNELKGTSYYFFIFSCPLIDKMWEYENVVVGKLKLKGKPLDVKYGSIKKKKKKKQKKHYDQLSHSQITGFGLSKGWLMPL